MGTVAFDQRPLQIVLENLSIYFQIHRLDAWLLWEETFDSIHYLSYEDVG